MRAQKKPSGGKHRGLNSTESGRAFRVRFRVQIYPKFRTYTTIKNNIRGVQL